MQITEIRTHAVDGAFRNWVFVEVVTDGELRGYGECSLESREAAVIGAVADMAWQLRGADALNLNAAMLRMTRDGYWESGPVVSSAAAGIEMALWDLLGKSLRVPLHVLLGGTVRSDMRAYSNAWYFGAREPREFVERARDVVAQGYDALKFDPFGSANLTIGNAELQHAIECITMVSDAVGPGVSILVEGHGRFSVESALRVGVRLEELDNILFFEEPVPGDDIEALAHLAARIRVPIAAGERVYSLPSVQRLVSTGAVSVLQPDIIHIGGIGRLLAAARIAEASSVMIAPHNASGPVATAATLHLSAVIPNLLVQEMFAPEDASWKWAVATPEVSVRKGRVAPPSGHGLGIELHPDVMAAHPMVPRELNLYRADSILDRPLLARS